MKKFLLIGLIAVMGVGFVGCGKKEAEKAEKPKAAAGAKKTAEAATVVMLNSSDQMKYDKAKIEVPAGKKVKLTLKHTGKMPKTAMGHNFVLLKAGTDIAAFAGKAAGAKASDFIPASEKGSIIANTKLLGGGESDTITFDAPAPGTYPFLCTFPGHFALMKGELIVK